MDHKPVQQQDERTSGMAVAAFSVFITVVAVFVCVLVTVLTVQSRPDSSGNTSGSGSDGSTVSDEPGGSSAPVFSPSGAILLPHSTANTQTVSTQIASDYAALVNARTGEIIAGKGADTRFSPASMTKIMTLLVACQRLTEQDLEQRVEYDQEIMNYTKAGEYRNATCHWSEEKYLGGRVAIRDLLYGIGVESAADCTIMVARYLVGKSPADSEAEFVQWMNEEAAKMGLQNTHFDNIIGYDSENNYSTASDLTAILIRALQCDLIADILSRPSYEFLAYYTDESGAEGSYRNYSYSTLFDARDTGSGRIGAYETQYGEFTIAPLTLGGGKTGSLEYETWEYSLASFATDSAGNTYVLVTGMCSQNAEVMRDAKTLYGYVRSD